MMVRRFTFLLTVALVLMLSLSVIAHDVVDGLSNPRGIAYDAEGNLYIVEAGNGGGLTAPGPFGPTEFGATGGVTRVAPDGSSERVVFGLGSMTAGQSRGAQDILFTDDAVWLLLGENPEGAIFSNALVELDPQTWRVRQFVDLFSIEAELNPDGDIIASNPSGMAQGADGRFYIADAGCNCVVTWAPGEDVSLFASWSIDENPVPTAVAVAPDGNIYVGFLSGFPFPEGGARIDVFSPDGELVMSYEGLTAVVDLLITEEGAIYAVEFGVFGDAGFGPGRVVEVTPDGLTPVAEDLIAPWGIAVGPDGEMVVVTGAAGGQNGAVTHIHAD